tara:strand:+ start:67 stop:696 length:630 start_codon:yes stop_codon:yes gene_type:complete
MNINNEIFIVGNSWSIPSDKAPIPAFDQLGLKNRYEEPGITLDAQANYIIENDLVNRFKVIWLVGHHHRADPRANGEYLLPYGWANKNDIWGELVQDIWFKKITRMAWYERTNALFVKAVLGIANPDNLMLIPIYRPNIIEQPMIKDHPCIWEYYLRDLGKDFADGQGHINQYGHNYFAIRLASEVYERWKITLQRSGQEQLKSDFLRR